MIDADPAYTRLPLATVTVMLIVPVVSTSVTVKPARMSVGVSSRTVGKVRKVISGASFTGVSEMIFVAVLLGAPVVLLRAV